jgi:hypothetical protein
MRVDVMSTTVTGAFDAMAVTGEADAGRALVMSDPRAEGRWELRILTGMLRLTAG